MKSVKLFNANMRHFLSPLLLFFAFPDDAKADQYFALTPSGNVQAVFPQDSKDAISLIANKCIDVGWKIISKSDSILICESPMSSTQSILGQALLGNSYSTPPRRFIQFSASSLEGYTRVQATGWIELQMAFGQIRRTDLQGPDFSNSVLAFLGSAGGSLPIGTTFPYHVYTGVKGIWISSGKTKGYRITEIAEGSPAQMADLRRGDVILKIAGKKTGSDEQWWDAAEKAAKSPQYEVEFLRDGAVSKVELKSAFRPSVQSYDFPRRTNSEPLPSGQASSRDSKSRPVADELAKLADLRDRGVLSEDEFQAEKKKLLSE